MSKGNRVRKQEFLERQLARETKAREHAEEIAERELRRYHLKNEELVQALNAKAEFCAMMSHELLSPLGGILSSLDAVHMGVYGHLHANVREKVSQTLKQAELMQKRLRILMECLASADVSDQLNLTDVSLDELLADLVEFRSPAAENKRIELSCEISPSIRIRTDRKLLRSAFDALMDNAVKFTESGAVAIRAGEFLSGRTIVVCIQDTGIGIEGQHISEIFEPFVQVDAGLNRAREGMGLGLYLAKKYLKSLKGDIRVSSQIDRGSCFTVALPMDVSEDESGILPHVEYERTLFETVKLSS